MTPPSDSARFDGNERYYADYRPGYGDEVSAFLVDHFEIDASDRVLDLGCGTGQLTLPLAANAGSVVAMDPNETMIVEGRRRAANAGVENIDWRIRSDTDIEAELGPLRLTTMGRSFHWMEQVATLDRLQAITENGGGVAIVDDIEWLTQGQDPWQTEVYSVVEAFLDDVPPRSDPAEIEYENPWDELLADRGFSDVEITTFDLRREWDAESIVGYVFSLSFCSPSRFGDWSAFEDTLRDRLSEFGDEPFVQQSPVTVLSGRV